MSSITPISPIQWEKNTLILLDQRLLPDRYENYICTTLEQAADGISDLVVRGAPAIGITAAYAVYLGYCQSKQDASYDLQKALNYLINARPTAVNLLWAVEQQKIILDSHSDDLGNRLLENARQIHQKDLSDNKTMGDFGAELIDANSNVLTHCNAGALATAGYGTALGVIRSASVQNKLKNVYASETRPWLQGLRLTAWELAHDQIPVNLIVEGAASSLFSKKQIDWVIVGADRICANGDVINKVGTANLAILAKHYGVSVMVAAPLSTVDYDTAEGDQVEIEERPASEIMSEYYPADQNVSAWNPVFDVTPASLVTAIVTEKGAVINPDVEKMSALKD